MSISSTSKWIGTNEKSLVASGGDGGSRGGDRGGERETSHATAVVDEVTYQEIVAQEVETAVSSQLPTSASGGSQ